MIFLFFYFYFYFYFYFIFYFFFISVKHKVSILFGWVESLELNSIGVIEFDSSLIPFTLWLVAEKLECVMF